MNNIVVTAAEELVVFLSNTKLFKPALSLCTSFSLSYKVVFHLLTHECILLMENDNLEAWNWLVENDIQGK